MRCGCSGKLYSTKPPELRHDSFLERSPLLSSFSVSRKLAHELHIMVVISTCLRSDVAAMVSPEGTAYR